ncbi:enoyl-CoA hydratase/isomerase family protein [Aurantimonas coralicida]|uniref:enoyl-CoA hydratase/isomerase family protein n=1 Tax=Aurantimonas coralicida TaxID=182270 RepID=UPI0035124CFE
MSIETNAANDDVLIRAEGRAGRITLNRPKSLNALSHAMSLATEAAMDGWATDPAIDLVIMDAAGDRAFCAGGDIQKIYHDSRAGDLSAARRFWAEEYRLNAKIARYPKPVVALMDGIVMGGGVGLGGHTSHRVVTERSMVAMPECAIGLVPDVGATLILANAPGRLGEYLALTGFRMGPGEAIAAGFADTCIRSDDLAGLTAALVESGDPQVIARFADAPPPSTLAEQTEAIDAAFSGVDAADILQRLALDGGEWAQRTAALIRKGSPISVGATLELVRAARAEPTIEAALRNEYRFTSRSIDEGELLEGIRAAVIDKDRAPKWSPARIEDLPRERVAAMLAPLGEHELTFDQQAGEERP